MRAMKNRTIREVLRGFTLCCFCLFWIESPSSAQSRRQVQVPEELIRSLSQEDKECVTTNGGVNRMFKAEVIHLKADGSSQILVQGSYPCECGAQNCAFWIYQRNGNGYQLLVSIDSVVSVRPRNASTNGYRDIVAELHSSAFETWISTYKFDDNHYQAKSCIVRDYLDQNGRQMKRPRFRKCQ